MRKSIKKIIALSISTISLLGFSSVGASAEWKQNSIGWWYTEGNSWSVGWKQVNNQWYYFDTTGYMKTGWLQDIDGKWYYLSPTTGEMTKNITTPDGYKIDENGVWINTSQTNTNTASNNTIATQPTITNNTNNNTTTSSKSHSSSSSSSSSSNSINNTVDYVTIFYTLKDKDIDAVCAGIQDFSLYADNPNASLVYGKLIINAKDYSTNAVDMVHNANNYEVKEDNGIMKLVKKSSTTGSAVTTTTSSAVMMS